MGDAADFVGAVEELGPNLTYLICRRAEMRSAFCVRGSGFGSGIPRHMGVKEKVIELEVLEEEKKGMHN